MESVIGITPESVIGITGMRILLQAITPVTFAGSCPTRSGDSPVSAAILVVGGEGAMGNLITYQAHLDYG